MTFFRSSLVLILSLILLTGQANFIFRQENTFSKRVKTVNYDIAIFNEQSPEIFPGQGKFTPNQGEIDLAEKALNLQLKELNADRQNQYETPVIDKNLKKYKRQYFGFFDANGNKIIYINCFWRNEKEESLLWLKEQVRVLDGGSYFWNVKFNLVKNELFDLNVNGNS